MRTQAIQRLLSIAFFVAFIPFAYHFATPYFVSSVPKLELGSRLKLPGINFSAHPHTLVMAVRPGCPWCTASGPFYKQIVSADSAGKVHLVIASPASVQDTKTYLDSLGVTISEVHQANLADIGVQGTPTLILVNQKGRIEATWIGKLAPQGESDVFKLLGIVRHTAHEGRITARLAG